jgi:hypothetical protein
MYDALVVHVTVIYMIRLHAFVDPAALVGDFCIDSFGNDFDLCVLVLFRPRL